MTYRRLCSYALVAGIPLRDAGRMAPGMICDLFIYRQKYDDEQHGLRRKRELCAD